jgi:hypothetical protein
LVCIFTYLNSKLYLWCHTLNLMSIF